MTRPPDHEAGRKAPQSREHPRLEWSRLLRSRSPAVVLEELGRWLGPTVVELVLTESGPRAVEIASWSCRDRRRGASIRLVVEVSGDPEWRLAVGSSDRAAPDANAAQRAALLLEAWRHAKGELARADRGLAARSREIDMIQFLGRRAAEARTADELFHSTASVLQRGEELDLCLVAYDLDGAAEMAAYVVRPFSPDYIGALARRAGRFLGWRRDDGPAPRLVELDGYDAARGVREAFHEEDLVLLPLMRKGRPIACLLVVPGAPIGERQLRLLYSASNQLSLHFERILSVRESEADRFRSILGSMPQGVLLLDGHARTQHANPAAVELLASCGAEAEGDLSETLERIGLRRIVDPVRRGRTPLAEGECRLDGDRVWSVTVSQRLGERGRIDGVVLVLTDVTERRRLQQQLAQSEKMSSLGQMISGVAHELNNPLASILGYAQLARAKGDDGQLAERLEILGREATRCKRIVQNLLSFARRHEPERKPFSLNQAVRNVMSLLDYTLRVDDIRVDLDLAQDLPALHGDAHLIEQVVVNLLTNAQQAIRQTREPGLIRVESRVEGAETCVLEVADSGPGIPEAVRSKIFDPFFTTKSPGQGTGLGLSLVHGIVTAHRGTIEVLSNPQGGSRFRLTFSAGAERDATGKSAPPAAAPFAPGRKGRILVVDDEEPVAQLICEALDGDGHDTQWVPDGLQALDRLDRIEFDLIISDLKMPDMNGQRLSEELDRRRPRFSRRLLLTTGDTLGEDSEEFVARSGMEVLRKPFDLDELRRMVRARLDAD